MLHSLNPAKTRGLGDENPECKGPEGRGGGAGSTARTVMGSPAERAMVGFQGLGLVGQSLPVVGGGPWEVENLAGEDAHGIHGLAELPIGEMGGTPQSIEIGLGAFGGTVAKSLGPVFRPADIIVAGGGLDRPGGEDLEEALAGRGDALAGWIWLGWGGHGLHIACS